MAMQQLVCWLCAFLALLLLKLIKKRGARTTAPALKLPPSPSSLPFIHNLHHLLRSPIAHRAVADIARELDAPLMYLQLGELPAVFVSSADAAREMMKVHDMKFAWRPYPPTIQKLRPMGKGIFFAPYGALWRQLRKISIVKLLSVRRVHSGYLTTYKLVENAYRQRQKRKEAMAAPSTRNAVTGEEEDLMDELMRIHEEGDLEVPLTIGNIKAVTIDLFGAGTETSSDALQWAMSELMRNPRVMQKAQAELRDKLRGKPTVTEADLADMTYLKLVVKETLRLHPALPLLVPRECNESARSWGTTCPKASSCS
ncbi:hypothetical protein VPH35_116642 [Triticum aestivum]